MTRSLPIALGVLASPAVRAASIPSRPFAAPGLAAGPAPTGLGGLGEVTLALAAVLATILALAWLIRRLRGVGGRAESLAVLAEVRVGPKERAVLIKVGAAQLLVGVAPGQVNMLHVLSEPVEVGGGTRAVPERASFRALLARSLGKP